MGSVPGFSQRAQNQEEQGLDQLERGWAFGIMKRSGSMTLWALASLLALGAVCAQAQEKSVLGKIVQLSAEQGRYAFQFEPRAGEQLVAGCSRIDIELRYSYRPDTWLPFARGTYPSRKQTDAVVGFLKRALREGREIYLGSAKGELVSAGKPCKFASHALALEYRGERELVVAYYGK